MYVGNFFTFHTHKGLDISYFYKIIYIKPQINTAR